MVALFQPRRDGTNVALGLVMPVSTPRKCNSLARSLITMVRASFALLSDQITGLVGPESPRIRRRVASQDLHRWADDGGPQLTE